MKKITTLELSELVYNMYNLLDLHAPVEELVQLLSHDDIEFKFPEATLTTIDEFKAWYKIVVNKFFDEKHVLRMLNFDICDNSATVNLVVNWQAKTWNAPDAKSKWLGFNARQTWVVIRDEKTQKAVISRYIVKEITAMEGSAPL